VKSSINDTAILAALAAIESESATLAEKIQMLIELATDLQQQPKNKKQLYDAVFLYTRAIEISSPEQVLLKARALAGMGTALRTIESQGPDLLLEARAAYEEALPILEERGSPEEVAEVQMNLGLVLQGLVPFNLAELKEALQLYQRALRVFTGESYPQEYAILQNNIAIAYLSAPLSPEGEEMRQALAVQSFEQALKWVTLIDHPREYAMLQNNLANALQYLPSTHPVDNNLRALKAYNEALKVRTARDTPVEYANTISNKANVLYNLPDDLQNPKRGNLNNLLKAQSLYEEALEIFARHGELERSHKVEEALSGIEKEILAFEMSPYK
jgi:tetratricopeptide (TPR) repeat protein